MKKAQLVIKKGFSAIEVLLASSIFIIIVSAFVGAIIYGNQSQKTAGQYNNAVLLAGEAFEAVRNIRDSGYANLPSTDGVYYLSSSGNQWSLVSTPEPPINGFTRSVNVTTIDPNTKEIVVNIDFAPSPQRTKTLSFINRLTNWSSIAVVSASWATPGQDSFIDFAGLNDALKVQVQGNYAYIVRNDGTPDFIIVDFSNTTSPSIVGSLSLSGIPNNIFVSGNYAYVSSSNNSQELQIINISNPELPSVEGSFDAAGNSDGRGIYVLDNIAYLGKVSQTGADFFTINISNPSAPTLVGSLDLAANTNEIYVLGNYAYVASSHNNQELQVISVINPASLSLVGSYDPAGNTDAFTVSGQGNFVYLGRGNVLYAINVSTPAIPSLSGSIGTPGIVHDISLNLAGSGSYLFVTNGSANQEFQVYNITNPSSLSVFGTFDPPGNSILYGVAYDLLKDRAFIVGNIDAQEFTILKPQ
jgi:Tfp pilus assembly protein PilV